MRNNTLWLLMSCVWMVAACGSTPPTEGSLSVEQTQPTLEPVTLPMLYAESSDSWTPVQLIGQAEQLDAPQITLLDDETPIFTWTGSQGSEARHFSRARDANRQVMALPAYFPSQQGLFPTDEGVLMFWLDRTADAFDLRVQVGRFSQWGVAELGPVNLSDAPTQNYSVVALDDDILRLVWSGGLGQTTNLYLNQVDIFGRPFGGERLRIGGDYPVLIRASDDTVHLFWLENNGRDVFHATFIEGNEPTLTDIQRISTTNIAGTDTIISFDVAYDGEHVTLIWHIRRINNTRFVLTTSSTLTTLSFAVPDPLRLPDSSVAQWLTPTQAVTSPLPMVAHDGNTLSLVWWDDGALQSIEALIDTDALIGAPAITSSPRTIGITWAQPSGAGYANFLFTQRRR